MTSTQTMRDVSSGFRSLYMPVALFLALVLGLLWMAGYGPGGSRCGGTLVAAPAEPAMPAPAPAPAAPAAPAAPVAAPVAAAPPAEKIYFDSNSTSLPADAKTKTAAIVGWLVAHPEAKAVLSGFHDPKGNKAANEALALNRARAVRTLLEEGGIAKDRVVMAKPVETTGDGTLAEARRVELSVQP